MDMIEVSGSEYIQLLKDKAALDRIALLVTLVNDSDSVLSGKGIDVLSEYVESTGRKVR